VSGAAGGPVTELALERLRALGGSVHAFKGQVNVTVPVASLTEALRAAKDAGFGMIADVFGIDYLTYPGHQGKRFTVAYNLHTLDGRERVFLRVDLDDGDTLPTITPIWEAANFMEREVYDMFGVVFEGHPDLRKILTPEDLEGHPHRKDFPLGETPTLFNEGRFLDPAAFRAGLMGGDPGLTGWKGGARKGVVSEQEAEPGDGSQGEERGEP